MSSKKIKINDTREIVGGNFTMRLEQDGHVNINWAVGNTTFNYPEDAKKGIREHIVELEKFKLYIDDFFKDKEVKS